MTRSLLLLGVGNRCTATARSKGFSSIFVLNKADLHAAVKDYPLAQEILRQRGKSLMKSSHFGCQAGKSYNLHCTDSEMKVRPMSSLDVVGYSFFRLKV